MLDIFYRTLIKRKHREGLSIEEIAAQTPYPVTYVASVLGGSRAVLKLPRFAELAQTHGTRTVLAAKALTGLVRLENDQYWKRRKEGKMMEQLEQVVTLLEEQESLVEIRSQLLKALGEADEPFNFKSNDVYSVEVKVYNSTGIVITHRHQEIVDLLAQTALKAIEDRLNTVTLQLEAISSRLEGLVL